MTSKTTCAALVLMLIGVLAPAASASMTFQSLGYLSGGTYGSSRAMAVSADGSVIVGQDFAAPNTRAWRWTQASGMVRLVYPGLPGTSPQATARGLSADGSVVVGAAITSTPLAWRWTSSGGMQNLGTMPGDVLPSYYDVGATGVSADGSVVVGNFTDGGLETKFGSRTRAFRWTAADGMVRIGSGNYTAAYAVSADGSTIVGLDQNLGAFRWTQAQGMVSLGTFTGSPNGAGPAYAVSADGSVIAGGAEASGANPHAWRWTAAEGYTDLGTGTAYGVSGDGSAIVGNDAAEGFYWTADGGRQSIRSLIEADGYNTDDWGDFFPTGISGDGSTIVGFGDHPGYSTEAWVLRVPEPAAMIPLFLGITVMRPHRHRQ